MENERTLTHQVVENSFWNFSLMGISRAGALVFMILLTRFLMPEKLGIYSLALSIAMVFLSFTELGINSTIMKYVSEELGKKKNQRAAAYFYFLSKHRVLFSLGGSILLALLAYPLANYIFRKPFLFLPLLLFSVYIFFVSIISSFESLFYAIKKVKYVNVKEAVFQISRIVLILLVFFILEKAYYVEGVILSLLTAALIVLLLIFYFIKKAVPFLFEKSSQPLTKEDRKRLFKFMIFVSIGAISAIFFGYVDTLMIGALLPVEYVGYYFSAFTIISSVVGFLLISNILLPVFSQLDSKRVKRAFEKVAKYTSILTIPALFGLLVLGKHFIIILYGEEYISATLPLIFLSFLVFELPFSANLISLILSRGKSKVTAKFMIFATVLNIILNYTLITILMKVSLTWAIGGAAIATVTSRFFYTGSLLTYSYKKLKVKTPFSQIIKPLFSAIVMAGTLFAINLNISTISPMLVAIEVIGGAIIYFAILFLIKGVSKKELQIFLNKNAKKIKKKNR